MTEDLTKDLTTDEILRLILSRLDKLEAQGEKNTTRPLLDQIVREMVETREMLTERLDGVDARLASLEQESKTIRRELGLLREDVRNERMARAELAERISDLEQRPN